MQLVIVESPAKAKTIEKYLGKDYKVLASYGHIRDLPPKDGSVRPDEDFAMDWELYSDKGARVKAHDYRAMENMKEVFKDQVEWCHDPVTAAAGADAVALVTDHCLFSMGLHRIEVLGALHGHEMVFGEAHAKA